MVKPRKTLEKLEGYLKKERFVILLGSRQVGKTTLLKMLETSFNENSPQTKVYYFTMETTDDLRLLSEGVKGLEQRRILNKGEEICLLIDEFHYLHDPNRLFKEIYDSYPSVKIVASGSSSLEIQQKIKESLAGRKLTLHVYPLDFYEYLQFIRSGEESFLNGIDLDGHRDYSKKIQAKIFQEDFYNFILFGGLPRVVLESDTEVKKLFLEEIYSTYIQKDIKGILKNIEIVPFNQLIELVASQVGNLLNIAELSNTLRLPRHHVVRHLEVLKETFVNFLLRPYATNKRTEVVKTPKTFFYDNGVRNQILKQFGLLSLRADAGALFENAIFMELKKNLPISQDLYFWRTKNKTEVDFILRLNERLFPIEVKRGSEKNIPLDLRSFAQTHNVDKAFILNATEWSVRKEGEVTYFWIPHFLAGKISEWIQS
ncbi:MAG: hypothetical protein A3B79_04700 [Deltaproteobacteria bacterium RIFCSPHIGHO2_02_FULL_50_15]|nr:MAG: hypothetical protein A3B79_04700 [Deltaproteobacteria bacterium RIFCSPHIGHO2_02_FULL_50_15]